ncbi:MAG TPA: hypothetical protein VEX60_11360 [Pyrinomonadaceae bacterium]|nr:hypothetical protein [Pyrinomonadaceae bacterium]
MGQTFLPRFQQMVAELREHPQINVTEVRIASAASREEVEAAKRMAEGRLPEGMEDFYLEMNGFLLEWEHKQEELRRGAEINRGSVEILPIGEVLKGWQGVTWFEFEGGERFKSVKPLDFFAPEACAALVHSESKGFASTVHYHYLGEFLCNTGYSFTQFIDRLLNARGFWYWIETLCPDTQQSPEAQNFLQQMPSLFEDFQPTLFQPGS